MKVLRQMAPLFAALAIAGFVAAMGILGEVSK